jgi:hypothetical protein
MMASMTGRVSLILALAFAVAACSAGRETPGTRAAAAAARAVAYRGPAIVTGKGDLAACPRKADFDQYRNDMLNMKVDLDDPGYEVARTYDLSNRRCIRLKKGERVNIEGDDHSTESLVRPLGESQAYWTTASWISAEALGVSAENVNGTGQVPK